jgi:hypothetical protein
MVSGNIAGGHKRNPLLNWQVTSVLEARRSRNTFKTVRLRRQYVQHFAGFDHKQFGFDAAVRPGVYRLNIKFENASGRLLGRFVEFFRAVRAVSEVKLAVSPSAVHAGDIGSLRVENFGTVRSSYFYDYRIWSIGANGWTEVPLGPRYLTNDLPILGAGVADSCLWFEMPAAVSPGEYLIGIHVDNYLLAHGATVYAHLMVVA